MEQNPCFNITNAQNEFSSQCNFHGYCANRVCVCQIFYDSNDNCDVEWDDRYAYWEPTIIVFAVLFAIFFGGTIFFSIYQIVKRIKTKKSKLTVVNAILFLISLGGFFRFLECTVDPWGYRAVLDVAGANLVWQFGLLCYVNAYALLIFYWLEVHYRFSKSAVSNLSWIRKFKWFYFAFLILSTIFGLIEAILPMIIPLFKTGTGVFEIPAGISFLLLIVLIFSLVVGRRFVNLVKSINSELFTKFIQNFNKFLSVITIIICVMILLQMFKAIVLSATPQFGAQMILLCYILVNSNEIAFITTLILILSLKNESETSSESPKAPSNFKSETQIHLRAEDQKEDDQQQVKEEGVVEEQSKEIETKEEQDESIQKENREQSED